jgi:DNA-binding MarR family transcriptional regulator
MHTLDANKLGAFGVLLSDALGNATADLSPSAAALLLSLFYRQDLTVTALAKVGGIAQPTAVRVLDGLVRQGFIERKGRAGRAARDSRGPKAGAGAAVCPPQCHE